MHDLTHWDFAAILVKLIIYASSFLAAGSTLFILANAMLVDSIKKSLRKIIWVSTFVGIVASIIQFGVQTGRLLDDGFTGMVDAEMIDLVWNGPLGDAVYLRIGGFLLLIIFLLNPPRSLLFAIFGTLILSISFSLVGHGTQEPKWLMGFLVSVHVLMISFWIGALWPLYSAAGGAISLREGGLLAHRFGKQAVWVVVTILVAGAILTYNLVGSLEAMWNSSYGLTLVIKLVLVVALLGLAANNKLKFVPSMLAHQQEGALRLRRSIRFETLVFVMILSVTTILTTINALPND